MASPLPPEELSAQDQFLMTMPLEERQAYMSGLEAAKNFNLGAYQAQYQKTQAAQDAALKAAQATGLSDQYTQLYGGADIIPGMTQGILSNLGIENPYLPVYTLRGTANKGGDSANERMSFAPLPGMDYRLVDKNTGQVMTASTPEEIKALAEAANALGKSGGPMANYAIESGQGGNYSTMYEDRPDISKFDRLAGMALPIAVSLIPGLQGVGAVLANAGAGAAGAAIAGGDPLKGGIMGGLTAAGTQFLPKPLTDLGLGAKAAKAVGAGIGATAGGIATGQPIEKALMGGALAGGTTYLGGELFGGNQPQGSDAGIQNPGDLAYGSTGAANATNNLNIISQNAAAQLASAGLPTTSFSVFSPSMASTPSAGAPGITVTGTPVSTGAAPSFTVAPSTGLTKPEIVATAKNQTRPVEDKSSFTVNNGLLSPEIIATAQREAGLQDKDVNFAINPQSTYGLTKPEIVATADVKKSDEGPAVGGPYTPVKSDYVVTGTKDTPKFNDKGEYTGTLTNIPSLVDDMVQEELAGKKTPPKEKSDLDKISDYMKLAGLVLPLLGGGGGGGGAGGKYSSTKNLGSTFSAKLPTPGQGGAFTVGGLGSRAPGAAGTFSARPVTDWYRYGMGRAMDIPEGMDLSGATSPYAGYGPGTLGEETFRRITAGAPFAARREPLPNMISSLGKNATLPQIETALAGAKTAEEARQINPGTVYFNIDAATANALGDPSLVGTVMSIQDLQRRMAARPMAHGGSMGYARGSSRESFAVEGPGTGRSDDIPAVLSDGEYVIDAETVALLGDGSSKAGAKKLDEMRVKVRKAKGKNLAKGKFSVNAKRPEAYMSGGRI